MTNDATRADPDNDSPQSGANANAAEKAMKQTSKTSAEVEGDLPEGPDGSPERGDGTQPPPSHAPADPSVARRGA